MISLYRAFKIWREGKKGSKKKMLERLKLRRKIQKKIERESRE